MPTKAVYYFRFGSRRVPWMVIKQGQDGSEYVIFPMDRTGFKISIHPLGANPHMKDSKSFYQELDLDALRSMNQNGMATELQQRWESWFYWPGHRADLIAIPGPEGKTWLEGVEELFHGYEVDFVALLKATLGHGTIYKVGYRDRKAFFGTKLGAGSIVIDSHERRFGFYADGLFPDRPLLGMRWEDGGFSFPMPPPLNVWTEALNARLELATEQYFDDSAAELEAALMEVKPDIEAFMDKFRVVRWKPEERGEVAAGEGQSSWRA